MSGRVVWLACLGLVCSRGTLFAEDAQKELQNLQGTWQVTGLAVADVVIDGNTAPGNVLEQVKLVVDGSRMSYFLFLEKMKTRIDFTIAAIDPTKTPKTIDAKLLTGPDKGKVDFGIYELEGNVLKLCLPDDPSNKRPDKFGPKSEDGSSLNFLTLRRSAR